MIKAYADQDVILDEHPYKDPLIAKDEDGIEFIFEKINYNHVTFTVGSYKIDILRHPKDINKSMRVHTSIGFYYPMKMQMPEMDIYEINMKTPRFLFRYVKELIQEYREFKKLMEEVAEDES